LNARSSAGDVLANVVADLQAPRQSVAGDVHVRHLNLAPLLNDPRQKSDITADGRVDLHSHSLADLNALHGAVSFEAPHLVAAGYVADHVKAKAQLDGRRAAVDAQASAYGVAATA